MPDEVLAVSLRWQCSSMKHMFVCFFSVSQRSLHTDSCLVLCVLSYTLMVYTFYCSVSGCYKSFGDMSICARVPIVWRNWLITQSK